MARRAKQTNQSIRQTICPFVECFFASQHPFNKWNNATRRLASSEMMWYVLSGDNISPTYNARSLIQRAWSRSPAALAFCWSKMLNVFSAYVLFFSLLALLVDAADSLKNGWRHRKCASTHQVDLGPSCIMIYTHIHALQSGLNCRLCRRRHPSRNKTMLWICTCTFGLLCFLS